MHRMTQSKLKSRLIATMAFAACMTINVVPSAAQAPPVPQADADYEASGYVVPPGMVHPSKYQGGVVHAGMTYPSAYQGGPAAYPGGVSQVGFFGGASCDGNCDGGCGSCDSQGYGVGSGGICGCGGNCGEAGCGLFDSILCGGDGCGCGCGNGKCCLSCLSKLCLFCGGDGCSACKSLCLGHMRSALGLCRPAGELCGLRWYDLSLEAVFLGHNAGGPNIGLTSFGSRETNPNAPIVLYTGDARGGDDLAFGARVSGALICGPGGNIEATYMGGNHWSDRAEVTDSNEGLYSFVSFFGTDPEDGYDDTDRSLVQSVSVNSDFHSVELNYRRRTMGPYCRFQGSWLVGLRYLHFQNSLRYETLGEPESLGESDRFFSSNDKIKNDLFGPQAGFDLWWNIYAGVRLGIECKAAWVQNDVDRTVIYSANSIGPGGTPASVADVFHDRSGAVMGDFQMKFVWQLSHSWKFRTAYYAVMADDIAFASVDQSTITEFVEITPISSPTYQFDTLVVQGLSFGTEYTW